jgi:nucleoside 2-deoxyribosyltransferase
MLVYLAGPIGGCTDSEAISWRREARAVLGDECCLDPMRRDYRGAEDKAAEEIVELDKADIEASDVILANCWQASWGTPMEIFYAHSLGKPVVVIVPSGGRVSPWLRYHAASVCESLGDALTETRGLAAS